MIGKTFRNSLLALTGLLVLSVATLAPQPAHAQAFSDYLENKLVDAILRNQAFSSPATTYVFLSTAACSDSSVGTEVANSNNYSRPSISSSLANWAGTQSSGSTTASSGTGGQTSNNNAITFATPSGPWGTVTYWGLIDSGTYGSGNILLCAALTTSKTINSGDSVSFAAGALTVTVQ